jgi:hypothetical protein
MAWKGRPTKTPEGFSTSLVVMGRTLEVRYVRSIRTLPPPKGRSLEGYMEPDKAIIWVATYRRHPDGIADTIWHEAKHFILLYCRREADESKYILSDAIEEQIVCALEAGDGALMRLNPWLHKLYGRPNTRSNEGR